MPTERDPSPVPDATDGKFDPQAAAARWLNKRAWIRGKGAVIVAVAVLLGGGIFAMRDTILAWDWVRRAVSFAQHPFLPDLREPEFSAPTRPVRPDGGARQSLLAVALRVGARPNQSAANPKQIAVLLAQLTGDPGDKALTSLHDQLSELPWSKGIELRDTPVLRLASLFRLISWTPHETNQARADEEAQQAASEYLKQTGAAAIVYGYAFANATQTERQPWLRVAFAERSESCVTPFQGSSKVIYSHLTTTSSENFGSDVDRLAMTIIAGYLAQFPRNQGQSISDRDADLFRRIETILRLRIGTEATVANTIAQRAKVASLHLLLADTMAARSGGYRNSDLADGAVREARAAADSLDPKQSLNTWADANIHAATILMENAQAVPLQARGRKEGEGIPIALSMKAEAEKRLRAVVDATDTSPSLIPGASARHYLGIVLVTGSTPPRNPTDLQHLQEANTIFREAGERLRGIGLDRMARVTDANRAMVMMSMPAPDIKKQENARTAVDQLDEVLRAVDFKSDSHFWTFAQFKRAEALYVIGANERDLPFLRKSIRGLELLQSRSLEAGKCRAISEDVVLQQLISARMLEAEFSGDARPSRQAARDAEEFAEKWEGSPKASAYFHYLAGAAFLQVAKLDPADGDAPSKSISELRKALINGGFSDRPDYQASIAKQLEEATALLASQRK